ncbi:MAG: DUF4097 family beta strand repeat protein [Bdellovibrionaceae bacterium]|nr:DUF4097 family beta strand repeat protein [Pseudobdellovibrionaceae bacterium]
MWLMGLFISQLVFAETLNFKPLLYSESEVKAVTIHGLKGNVRVIGEPSRTGDFQIRVSRRSSDNISNDEKELFENWIFSYKNELGHLELFVKEPADKEKLIKSLSVNSTHVPNFDIQIQGAAKPLNIWWQEGELNLSRWNQPIKVVQQKGKVSLTDFESSASIFINQGEVYLTRVKGSVDLESYKAIYQVNNYDGNMKLDSFSGKLKLDNLSGSLNIANHSGRVDILNSKGSLDFKMAQSKIYIKNFNGDIQGKTESGSVEAELSGTANARIHSVDGPVSLSLPQSAASVNIGSKKGQLIAPQYLRSQQWSSLKTISGQLRGKDEGGRIYVRSEGGSIRIR